MTARPRSIWVPAERGATFKAAGAGSGEPASAWLAVAASEKARPPVRPPAGRAAARAVGAASGTADVVDEMVTVTADRHQGPIVPSDPGDLTRIAGSIGVKIRLFPT